MGWAIRGGTINLKERPMFNFKKQRATSKRRAMRRRPSLEALEGRVVLSTLHVNTLADTVAVNPMVSPNDKFGHISLRSAIQFADANPKSSGTIIVPADTFTLTQGDLVILVDNKLTIEGSTKGGETIISGNNQDRVFLTLSGNVAMSNLVIEHGSVVGQGIAQGGGLLNDGATDTLTSVQFLDDFAVGQNGATGATGTVNGANGQAGGAGGPAEGGAICNIGSDSSLTLKNCSLIGNEATGGDGGPGGAGIPFGGGTDGKLGLAGEGGSGGPGGGAGAGLGGGVFNGLHASLILSGDTFLKNEAFGGSGGIGGAGASAHGGPGGNGTAGSGSGGTGGSAGGGRGGAGGIGDLAAGGGIYNGGGQVTLVGSTTTFTSNEAGGGTGGAGGNGGKAFGGNGGFGFGGGAKGGGEGDGGTGGGQGGSGAQGAAGEGGAIFNAPNGSISSTAAVVLSSNSARGGGGGFGGTGGNALAGLGGHGGNGTDLGSSTEGPGGPGGAGADAIGDDGGAGASGAVGEGGGIFNSASATITFTGAKNITNPPVSTFSGNKAVGGFGGNGGAGGSATGGNGGNGGTGSSPSSGGNAGSAFAGSGGNGGRGGLAQGGGLYDDGAASFTGVTVDFTNNQAVGGAAGNGGEGGNHAFGGFAGNGVNGPGGNGGSATGGNGGSAEINGLASGGGIIVDVSGTLSLEPRLGAKKGSKQASATDLITGNSATPGAAGTAGSPTPNIAPGTGGGFNPPGQNGTLKVGQPGHVSTLKRSVGGGIAIFGTAHGKSHTSVTGNSAIVFPNIDGTFST